MRSPGFRSVTPAPTSSTTPAASPPSPLGNWGGINAGAIIDVDEVQPDRGVADARLARTGLSDRDFLPDQNFGTAGFVKANGVRHGIAPLDDLKCGKSSCRTAGAGASRLDDDVAILDMNRKRARRRKPSLQFARCSRPRAGWKAPSRRMMGISPRTRYSRKIPLTRLRFAKPPSPLGEREEGRRGAIDRQIHPHPMSVRE